jgi:AraC-like DNA-binding protein
LTIADGAAPGWAGGSPVGHGTDLGGAGFGLTFLPVPSEIEGYVAAFFSLWSDRARIDDVLPAAVGNLMVMLDGAAHLRLRDGREFACHRTSLITPQSAAAGFVIDGPWRVFGATLTPLGWAALSGGRSAAQWGDRLVEAGTLLGAEVSRLGDALVEGYRAGRLDAAAMAVVAGHVLAAQLRHVAPRHCAAIRAVSEWLGESLSPDLADLIARTNYSPRQVQRLVDHYYGLGPKHLARKYRALRAAALLCDPDTPGDQVAHVAEQFYDQSHMIREIRLFAGCTPGRLTRADHPVMSAWLDMRNFARVTAHVAALPPGLGPCDEGPCDEGAWQLERPEKRVLRG